MSRNAKDCAPNNRDNKPGAAAEPGVVPRPTSQTRCRAVHPNAALVKEALGRVASPDVSDGILEEALAHGDLPSWDDVGAIFAFVGGALTASVARAMGEAAASAVCEDALALLMNRGTWAPDAIPPPAQRTLPPGAPAAPPEARPPFAAGVHKSKAARRSTEPYLSIGTSPASRDGDGDDAATPKKRSATLRPGMPKES